MKVISAILVCLLALASCKTIEPAAPEMTAQTAPVPEQPVSTIVLPVSVNLAEYYKLADNEVPKQFDGGEQHCDGVSFNYHFERDPLQLNANDHDVQINVSGKYRIKMNYCPECAAVFSDEPHCVIPRIHFSCGYGEPMRRMQLQYTSHFELTENYGLSTQTKLTDLKAIDPCEVTVFQYDATGQLLTEVRKALDALAKDIDKQTAAISFRPQARELWNQAVTPIAVPGYGFVQLRPDALHLLDPSIKNNILHTSLVLEARPLFTSYRPETQAKALPPLHVVKTVPNDTLRLITDLDLGYDSLSVIINRFAAGTKLLVKEREVIIDSVHIAGAKDRQLVFRVAFSGKKRGTLYLTGQPVFNPALQQIELQNVAFDLQTKSALLKTAEWLFSERILAEITKSSKQDLKPQLDKLLKELNRSLHFEQEGFIVSGAITQLTVDHIYPETDRLIVRVSAKGKLDATNIRK